MTPALTPELTPAAYRCAHLRRGGQPGDDAVGESTAGPGDVAIFSRHRAVVRFAANSNPVRMETVDARGRCIAPLDVVPNR